MTVPSPLPEPGQNQPIPYWVAEKYGLLNSGLQIDYFDGQPPRGTADDDQFIAHGEELRSMIDGTYTPLTWFEKLLRWLP